MAPLLDYNIDRQHLKKLYVIILLNVLVILIFVTINNETFHLKKNRYSSVKYKGQHVTGNRERALYAR